MKLRRSRFQIRVDQERCVGCFICQMRCSWRFHREFNPARSRILVDRQGAGYTYAVSFRDDCDACGICARHCVYGALSLM